MGTRDCIQTRSERHQRHSALMVSYYDSEVMIDCGEDWLGRVYALDPDAIVVTQAGPGHARGLQEGAACPVFATQESWWRLADYGLKQREMVHPRERFEIGEIHFEAFAVEHSTRAPAVGYRVEAGEAVIFYVPDVAQIHDREEALAGAQIYIGDGASMRRSRGRTPRADSSGHAPMHTQLTWCQKAGVPLAIFTHLGAEVVEGEARPPGEALREMAEERGVAAVIAYDGLEEALR